MGEREGGSENILEATETVASVKDSASDTDRVAHVVAVMGTQTDPVRLTLCGITLTDARHRRDTHGLCVVCEELEASLKARGLR